MLKKKKVISITLALGTMLLTSKVGHAATYSYNVNYNYIPRGYVINYDFYDNYSNQNYNYNWQIIRIPYKSTVTSTPVESIEPTVPSTPSTPVESVKPTVPSTPSAPVESQPITNPGISQVEMEVVRLVNIERQKEGLAPFKVSAELSKVAKTKSEDMGKNNYFSHTSPTYGSPFQMMKTFGIKYNTAGENIAKGYLSAQAVVSGWMNSSGHRANILNPSFKTIGVGTYTTGNGTIYWTQMFTN